MKTVRSEIAGVLTQSERFGNWWTSEPIAIPYFDNQKLKIEFPDYIPELKPTFMADADKALKNFLEKGEADRLQHSEAVHQNCRFFLSLVKYDQMDKQLWDIKSAHEIWRFVYLREILVCQGSDTDIYLCVTC